MKKPKNFITNMELSKMVTDVCIFLAAICGIYIIANAESLRIGFKIVDMIFLFGLAVIFGMEFILLCLEVKKRKEYQNEKAESEIETEENEEQEK